MEFYTAAIRSGRGGGKYITDSLMGNYTYVPCPSFMEHQIDSKASFSNSHYFQKVGDRRGGDC